MHRNTESMRIGLREMLSVKNIILGGKNASVSYREGTSDERVLKEVIEKRAYARKSYGFDVMPGERWLDLGANIGAFAVYSKLRGAEAICYEPEPECFAILEENAAGFKLVNAAVTVSHDPRMTFYTSPRPLDHYRGTLFPRNRFVETNVRNFWVGKLPKRIDGIKMDIEGGEGPLIESGLLPDCQKLVMEYHTSVDPSIENFFRRMDLLRGRFKNVMYPDEFDRAFKAGKKEHKPFFDRTIFCWN